LKKERGVVGEVLNQNAILNGFAPLSFFKERGRGEVFQDKSNTNSYN
jgi:hypothetical protein